MKRIIAILLSVAISVAVMGQSSQEKQQKFESFKKYKGIEAFNNGNTDEE